MKAIKIATLCAISAFILASCAQTTINEPQPKGITKSDVDSISYVIGYSFGLQLAQSDFGALNLSAMGKGIKDAASGDVDMDEDEFYRVLNGFMEKRADILREANIAEADKFFAENGKKAGVVTTESGIQYKVVREGNGVRPAPIDTVEVNYEGQLLNGKVFDSSYERGESATFPLDRVIPGWSEGITYASEGGEIELWIPSELAYGANGSGPIGPNAAIYFKVELIKVMPTVEEEITEE